MSYETDKAAEAAARKACTLNHTKYQPTEAEFCCPKCGAPVGDFCVDESENFECPDLHSGDGLVCMGKDGKGCPAAYSTSGQAFATMLVKRNNLVKCECCKGTGLVSAKKAKKPPKVKVEPSCRGCGERHGYRYDQESRLDCCKACGAAKRKS